jgi:hypothetical protein
MAEIQDGTKVLRKLRFRSNVDSYLWYMVVKKILPMTEMTKATAVDFDSVVRNGGCWLSENENCFSTSNPQDMLKVCCI